MVGEGEAQTVRTHGKRRRQIARTIQEWNGHSTDTGLAWFEFRFLTRSLARSLPAYARRYGRMWGESRGDRGCGAGLAIANERTAATQARLRHRPPGLPAGCQASA